MILWKKTFLITFSIVLVILFSGMVILDCVIFSDSYHQTIKSTIIEKDMVQRIVKNQLSLESSQSELLALSSNIQKNGQYFSLEDDYEREIVSSIPFYHQATVIPDIRLHKTDENFYFIITDDIRTDNEFYIFTYVKDITSFYAQENKNLIFLMSCTIILSVALGVILYFSLKKVYTPINNIAHELRTPLTGIQGYSQYLLSSSLSEEDRYFAIEQLLIDSSRLREIVEKLLVMGKLREGRITMEPIDFVSLLNEVKQKYPDVIIESNVHTVMGNETLLRSLLMNLTSNACRSGNQVKIISEKNHVIVWNDGDVLGKEVLLKLNQKQVIDTENFQGHGYGVRLCHEIIRLHKGKLRFSSSKEEGTKATIFFPPPSVTYYDNHKNSF